MIPGTHRCAVKVLTLVVVAVCAFCGATSSAVAALAPSEVAGLSRIEPDLTRSQAVSEAVSDAYFFWPGQGPSINNFCNGPYENVRHKTQWACYGQMTSAGKHNPYWQVNLDPYGEVTYHYKAY